MLHLPLQMSFWVWRRGAHQQQPQGHLQRLCNIKYCLLSAGILSRNKRQNCSQQAIFVSSETAVRFKILNVIATKLDKRYGTNKPYVDYIKVKPHLFVFKEGAYKQYRFSAAIQKFRAVIDQSDLEDVHKFAFSKNLKGASLKQFLIL